MKACEAYIDKIIMDLDGALAQGEKTELEEHLKVCPGCQSLYSAYRDIDAGIMEMELEPPKGLVKSVMREIHLEKEKTRPVYYLKRMKFSLAALAACLVLVVAGKFVTPATQTEATTGAQVPETMAVEPEMIEDTAWMPVYDEGEETAAEDAATMDEIPTVEAETEAAALDEGMMERSADGASEGVRAVLDALNRDGYRGDLVELFDMTEEEIYETFSGVETLLISSGNRVYQVSWEQFDAVEPEMHYGAVVSTNEVGDWVYLWIG